MLRIEWGLFGKQSVFLTQGPFQEYPSIYFTAAFKYLMISRVKRPVAIAYVTHLWQTSICLTPQKNRQNVNMLVIKLYSYKNHVKNNFLKILVTHSSWNSPPVPLKIAVVILSERDSIARGSRGGSSQGAHAPPPLCVRIHVHSVLSARSTLNV